MDRTNHRSDENRNISIARGDIFYVEKTFEATGSEQRAGRPAVIVSSNTNNKFSPVVEVVYLTTSHTKKRLPTHVPVYSAPRPSVALCEQVHSIDKQRLSSHCGTCTKQELQAINTALLVSFGLEAGKTPAPRVFEQADCPVPSQALRC